MKKTLILLPLLIFIGCKKEKGVFTLKHNGVVREYYVSYPEKAEGPCPLIINLHNFNGNANFIQTVSEMDDYALPANIAVVYPEGIDNSWNVGTPWDNNDHDDVGFIDVLIDAVASRYNIDLNRVYACGYSNGGYLAYELACHLAHKITAFGSIGGNFMLNSDQICDQDRMIPIIDFKGTSDPFVAYDVTFPGEFSDDGSLLVNENIAFWSKVNDLTESSVEYIEDLNQADSTTVEKIIYSNESHNTRFVHYKIINGGHQWFGTKIGDDHVSYIGFNNHEIHASEIIVDFFLNYQLSDFKTTDNSLLP